MPDGCHSISLPEFKVCACLDEKLFCEWVTDVYFALKRWKL